MFTYASSEQFNCSRHSAKLEVRIAYRTALDKKKCMMLTRRPTVFESGLELRGKVVWAARLRSLGHSLTLMLHSLRSCCSLRSLFLWTLTLTLTLTRPSPPRQLFLKLPFDPFGPSRNELLKMLDLDSEIFDYILEYICKDKVTICYTRPRSLRDLVSPTRRRSNPRSIL